MIFWVPIVPFRKAHFRNQLVYPRKVSHRIHVGNIYLHLADSYGKCIQANIPYMDPTVDGRDPAPPKNVSHPVKNGIFIFAISTGDRRISSINRMNGYEQISHFIVPILAGRPCSPYSCATRRSWATREAHGGSFTKYTVADVFFRKKNLMKCDLYRQ